jgi:hypothetical protein
MKERLHPASIATLEQLVKLHGVAALIAALREIEARLNKMSDH